MPYILSTDFYKKNELFSTNFLKLSEAHFQRRYRVTEVLLPNEQKQRLAHVGAYVGSTVTPLRKAPLADPTEYMFGDIRIGIRKCFADKIVVRELSPDD